VAFRRWERERRWRQNQASRTKKPAPSRIIIPKMKPPRTAPVRASRPHVGIVSLFGTLHLLLSECYSRLGGPSLSRVRNKSQHPHDYYEHIFFNADPLPQRVFTSRILDGLLGTGGLVGPCEGIGCLDYKRCGRRDFPAPT
jgi:hypothetical protein